MLYIKSSHPKANQNDSLQSAPKGVLTILNMYAGGIRAQADVSILDSCLASAIRPKFYSLVGY